MRLNDPQLYPTWRRNPTFHLSYLEERQQVHYVDNDQSLGPHRDSERH